jgi:hypothetical protein
MKVWGFTDPRSLKDKHLLGEHLEIHTCISGGWENHPESLFNRFDGDLRWPVFRHELIRLAMNQRWQGRHTLDAHKSPIDDDLLDNDFRSWIRDYESTLDLDLPDAQELFELIMTEIDFPETGLDYDRPWEREGISMNEYWALEGVRAA